MQNQQIDARNTHTRSKTKEGEEKINKQVTDHWVSNASIPHLDHNKSFLYYFIIKTTM